MMPGKSSEEDAVTQIRKLYEGLSDRGKDEFAAQLAEDEDLMSRLLDLLLEKNEEAEGSFNSEGGFADFLRKVRED